VLPARVGWLDQYSHCSYDRAASYEALTLIFCAGFIVPCLVMVYCYAMIWRRTRQVGRQVDNYKRAYRQLQVARQHSVHADDRQVLPLGSVPADPQALVHATPQTAQDTNHHEMATQDDKNSYSDDVMECQQRTVDADFPDRLLPAAVTSATTVVARMEKSNDETPQNTSTVIQWSSTISEHRHTSTCLSHNNDEEEEQTKPQTTTKHEGY